MTVIWYLKINKLSHYNYANKFYELTVRSMIPYPVNYACSKYAKLSLFHFQRTFLAGRLNISRGIGYSRTLTRPLNKENWTNSESELLLTPSSAPHSIKQTTINRVRLHPFTNRIPTPATSSSEYRDKRWLEVVPITELSSEFSFYSVVSLSR